MYVQCKFDRRSIMPGCPECGRDLMRRHRKATQRIWYAEAFSCPGCDYQVKRMRPMFRSNLAFLASRHSCCVKCGTMNVHRMAKRDRIDTLSHNLFSWIFRLTGAPLTKCSICRLQYC